MRRLASTRLIILLVLASPVFARPPNVVLIISDDQAWGDFGFMDHPVIKTPHLDKLAIQSAVFPRGYVPSSLCRPSLASMITGLYPHQHKITGNDPPKGVARDRMLKHIDSAVTLPRLLGKLGYRSLQTGKWWEGNCRCGGFTEGMTHGDPKRGGRHGDVGLKIGRETMQPIYDFIQKSGEAPFFLWYAPFLPHNPHNPPDRLLKKYRKPGRSLHVAKYFAMCEWFDETCGQLLDHLEEKRLKNDTVVLFVVDNGWIQHPERRRFAPKSKTSPYDGGIRTPIMVRWPGKVRPGRHETLVSSIDLAPTILRACGAEVPAAMPGIDLIRFSQGESTDRNSIFGSIFAHDVVDIDVPAKGLLYRWGIEGHWKLILPADPREKSELYDLEADPHEEKNLASEKPRQVERLTTLINGWWPASGGRR